MKCIKEEYTNKEGKKVFIERFIGKKEQCVLATSKSFLSPMVEHIEYDEENDVFFLRDVYDSIVEDGSIASQANVYFYMDFDGNPIGFAYTDAFDGMFAPIVKDEVNEHHDRWFLGYGVFKRELGLELGKIISKRTNHYNECAKKMLTVYKAK